MNGLLCTFAFFLVLIYLLINDSEYPTPTKSLTPQPKEDELKDAYVHLVHNNKNFLSINDVNGGLYISKDQNKAELFKVVKINESKIGLQSTTVGYFLMINYTSFYNYEYDVVIKGVNLDNNATKLKLLKDKKQKQYYLKFYNNYYFCIDYNGNLFACRDKSKIFYFNFKKLTN